MDNDLSLILAETTTKGGSNDSVTASSSTISLFAALKSRFQVKDCSIKLEIVDTTMMATKRGNASTPDEQDVAVPVKIEKKEDIGNIAEPPPVVAETATAAPTVLTEMKEEPTLAASTFQPAADSESSSSKNTSNGSVAVNRPVRKRPRKTDPSGKTRDVPSKSKESMVKPSRPTASKLSSRLKKPRRRYDGYLDEVTAHSETSESLFNEINWEENLDCDTSALVDEFAPRPTKPVGKIKPAEVKKEDFSPIEPIGHLPSVMDIVGAVSADTLLPVQEFRSGIEINVLDYKTSTWNRGTVTEVDWDEDEVLIIYDDRSEEWVSMSSQRLSRCTLKDAQPEDESVVPVSNDNINTSENNLATSPTSKSHSLSPIRGGLSARKRARLRSSGGRGKSSEGSPRNRRDRKRKRPSPNTPTTAPSSGAAHSQDGPMRDDKFEIGEKVLAKWSDFRMQKFPAIIKKISGNGSYDLLFYDGFEKTIRAENVFKTTEEEVARYKRTNPSEADVFVDIDADSKEARRQRKKKSFGDNFLSASDFPKKRSSFGGQQMPPIPGRADSNLSGSPSGKQLEPHEHAPPTPSAKRSRHSRRSNEEGSFLAEELAEPIGSVHESLKVEEPPKVKERVIDRDRFLGAIPEGATPLKMSLPDSDVFQKTVVMPDKRLPPGWVKHCMKCEGSWKAFLLSPDRFKITNRAELAEYAHKMLKTKSPKKISFQFLEDIIPELIEKQKDLEPSEDFQPWIRKKSIKKMKLPPAHSTPQAVHLVGPEVIPGSHDSDRRVVSPKSQGGVKTLLPKYRAPMTQASSLVQDDSETTGLLKCIKEGCDKKFRKESLLHMHLKHYHEEEFKKIVMMAPRVDELASARTESGYKAESPVKVLSPPVKKPTPKLSPLTPESIKTDHPAPIPTIPHSAPEEKKSTIKTLLPRQSTSQDVVHPPTADTMDMDHNEDDFAGFAVKNRLKKPKLETSVGSELGYPVHAPSSVKHAKKKSLVEKTEMAEEGKASPSYEFTDDGVPIERLRSEELINCICGFREEDGLMIQCDICMCWQHGICSGMMTDSEVPERYVCYICRNPPKVRSSQKYSYALHYLTQGKLASFTFRKKDENDLKHTEAIIKKSYDILGSLHNMENVECSLRAKLNIAQRSDHPKLYLWAKNWETQVKKDDDANPDETTHTGSRIPVPEAPIDLDECRSRLLDHIDSYVEQLDTRLNTIHSQLLVLDSQDDNSESADTDKLTKQVLHTINNDLITVKKLAKLE